MRIRRALDAIRIERLRRSLKYEGLFSAAKIARLKNTRVYLTANIVDYMCAIAHQYNSLRELIFSQLLHFNEDIYLECYETMGALKAGIVSYFRYYNLERLHLGLDYASVDLYLHNCENKFFAIYFHPFINSLTFSFAIEFAKAKGEIPFLFTIFMSAPFFNNFSIVSVSFFDLKTA